MNNTNEKDRFLPALILGITGGVCSLCYVSMVIFTASELPALKDAVGVLYLLSFSAVSLWMGGRGKNATKNKTFFYIPLALAVVYIEMSLYTTIKSAQTLISASEPFAALTALAGVCAFGVSVFSALSVLFFIIENRRGCKITALLATACLLLCVLPYAYLYATGSPGVSASLLFYVKAACFYLAAIVGEVFGAWALYLYLKKYMPRVGESAERADKKGKSADAAVENAPDGSSSAAASASKLQKAKIILVATVAVAIFCAISYAWLDASLAKKLSEEDSYRSELNIERTKYHTSYIPKLAVRLTAQSEREIRFEKKNVTVRFLGAGVDANGSLCIIADITNASGAVTQIRGFSFEKVNGYDVDMDIFTLVEPLETLRIKIPIESLLLKTSRTDINNISSAVISMSLAYGEEFNGIDASDYECRLEFDVPEKYVVETEENKTKADSVLCYTDENVEIYYQGLVSYDTYTYLAFFVQSKNPALSSVESEEVVPCKEYVYFGASAYFYEEASSAFLCGRVDVTDGAPETFECTFKYAMYPPQGEYEQRTITFSVDPSKVFGE